ncbi:MAG: HAMP domain-containing protein [Desulfuromonadales bacterium]|nr:HAMP domain-containing protein [Desulfuromonadales bacterium]
MSIDMTIKGRLIVTIGAIALLSIVCMGIYSYQSQKRQLQHHFSTLAKSENRLFESILHAEQEGLSQAIAGFSRLELFQTPLADKNREELLAVAAPVFAELKARHHITHMYFIAPDGTVLLRVHRPEQYGDRLTRATFLQAAATQEPASGLEMGRNFFSLRCVAPVYAHGKLLGYLELAEEIDHVFAQMKAITGNDVCLFLPEDYIKRYNPELPMAQQIPFSIFYPTDPQMPMELSNNVNRLLLKGLGAFVVETIDGRGGIHVVGVGPIKDAFGKTAGVLFSRQNVSMLYALIWRGVFVSLAVFATILIIGNILLFLSMKKSLTLFRSLSDHIQNVTRTWDLERNLEVSTNDEIGELAYDFNQMQGEVRKLKSVLEHRAQELTMSNQELESFSYSLSHDLRLPLTRIYSAAQILQEMHGDSLDETGRFLVDNICKGCVGMEELIEAILTLSKLGRQELHPEPIDLSAMVRDLAVELDTAETEHKVTLCVPEQLISTGDRLLLKVALKNLLENAWKYTRPVADPRVELGVKEQAEGPVIFVRDNGVGFDMQHADKLFVPFKRLHDSSEFTGTGIGLATVQKVIHRHGGTIWGQGMVGKGSTFYFTLPSISTS